jgi:hypothetical protein
MFLKFFVFAILLVVATEPCGPVDYVLRNKGDCVDK